MAQLSSETSNRNRRLVYMSLLSALIVVFQMLAYAISNAGVLPVAISLSLVPIVVGVALFGPKAGALLGGVFGLVTVIGTVTGIDAGAYVLFSSRPFITILLCLVKAATAGFLAGLVYRLVAKENKTAAVFCAAVVCPVVNTGIFCLAMVIFYMETLTAWAGGVPLMNYIIFSLAGLNFIIELAINLVLSPVIVRIISIKQR